jgi:hypothetical protein
LRRLAQDLVGLLDDARRSPRQDPMMHRLISIMVIVLLVSACSARAESQGLPESPLDAISGGPEAGLAAPAPRKPAPDLQDGSSNLVRRNLVTDAHTDEQGQQEATTGAPREAGRPVVISRRFLEKLMRNDPALAEAVDSVGDDLAGQTDRNPILRVYLDGTFEWIHLVRDGPVPWSTRRDLALSDPDLLWAMQSIIGAGGTLNIHVYADGSWEYYYLIREKRPTPTGGGDTLCGPTECDP